jgi:hypothetical protein
MEHFDLAIAYTWELDNDFIYLLESVLQAGGFKTYIITLNNLDEVYAKIKGKELSFTALLDRASDDTPSFEELPKILLKQGTYITNRYTPFVKRVVAKATMHEMLLENNFKVPFTLIAKPYDKKPDIHISEADFAKLSKPFVVKPSFYSGAGEAVNLFANNEEDIKNNRLIYTDDQFLIQKKIYPHYFDGRRCWFRVYYFFGKIVPLWWDDLTHVSTIMFPEEVEKYKLQNLYTITRKLSKLARLDYFSTEITYAENGEFYLIDYVNDQCDFRCRSKYYDGVPEGVIVELINRIAEKIVSIQKNKPSSIVRRIFK